MPMNRTSLKFWLGGAVIAFLALIPVYSIIAAQPFYVTLFSRIMIFALAALALNFILGYGGLVSFGHALYLGVGAYAVGMLADAGIANGWAQLAAAIVVGALMASLVGAIVLRTGGMIFIMITLAFAQMGYFFIVSLKAYGGDDGLTVAQRSDFGLFSLEHNTVLYYAIFLCLVGALWMFARMIDSRFGMVLRGCKVNERRMLALGFPVFRYKLVAYVLSAEVCVIAGFLMANLTKFASPAYMAWTISGDLIVMIVLGGMNSLIGPIVGAISFLIVEEVLSSFKPGIFPAFEEVLNKHWLALLGVFVILVVLFAKRGIYGYLTERDSK
jgi:branched-chain amino acid transport system permease protein